MRSAWRDGDRERVVELSQVAPGRFKAVVDGATIEIDVETLGGGRFRLSTSEGATVAEVSANGPRRFVRLGTMDFVLEREAGGRRRKGSAAEGGLESPMPGVVTRVLVAAGDEVSQGQPLVALEAMKMEHLIRAPRDGRVAKVAARVGEMVNGGVALVELEEASGS